MKRLDQHIYAIRLTSYEARALLKLLNDYVAVESRVLERVRRRLEKTMDLMGDGQ